MKRRKTASQVIQSLLPFVSKYLEYMENVQTCSPHTLRSYRLDLRQAFGALSSLKTEEPEPPVPLKMAVTEDELLGYCRAAMTSWSKLAPASRNRKAACLKSFLNWLFEKRVIDRKLALHVHGPKIPLRLPHHLSVDEAMAVLTTLSKQIANAGSATAQLEARYDEALILLMYGGGLRVSEVCGARWKDIDSSARVIRVVGKGGKERLVALPDRVLKSLSTLPREGDFVFGTVALPTRRAFERVRTAGRQAGLLQPLHPHALRHSFATHLLTSGANLRSLQELLGHSSLQATQRYTHIGIDQLANTLEKFHPHGNAQPPKRRSRSGF